MKRDTHSELRVMLGSSAPTIGSWIRPLPRKVKRRWVSERAEQCGAKISRRSHTSTHQETSVPDTAAPHRDDRCFNERSTRIKLKTAVGFVGRKPTTLLHARSVPLPPSTYRLSSTTHVTESRRVTYHCHKAPSATSVHVIVIRRFGSIIGRKREFLLSVHFIP